MPIVLDSLNLAEAERKLCEEALVSAGSIVEAATLLGITRHALKRRIVKHQIEWPRPRVAPLRTPDTMLHRSAIAAF
ncbi:Bacterial regulatory protein, Fis family [Enhygromyxa salina]|uniref:Bacterial regulatory protein, Fis family n=1 Tax=Enhygromyxa salina TaxID=215803 RepID=A0A2S9XRZ5_9BACT|nr:helix-turn-helix domain-containing protein [Enhygromyxa salina]PRP95471.1 Bacterial regulatory protein, Fis family [Enhygromyxa salina]